MDFTLKVMGSASAKPVPERFQSAQVLSVRGRSFLIDCGEGVQTRLQQFGVSPLKIDSIFISHIHGDHVFGIFGLLSTMAMLGRTQELHIYAPRAFGDVLRFFLSAFGDGIAYEIIHHPLEMQAPEVVHTSRYVEVRAFPLRHKIECYGFRFDELVPRRRPSNEPFRTRSYAYCSDTMPFPELAEWVKGVDILYHESTYPAEMADKAAARFHSTSLQAAECARDAGVGRLLLGHYSSRVRDLSVYAREAQAVFPDTVAADDGDTFDF